MRKKFSEINRSYEEAFLIAHEYKIDAKKIYDRYANNNENGGGK